MKLLLDQNLSPRLAAALADCYPEATHVRKFGLEAQPDADVWAFAAREDLVIVTKDSDFRQRSFLYGHPPKVIWIGVGNCSTQRIERLLRERQNEVAEFLSDSAKAFLALTS